jgi:hypothetical protein
LTVVGGGSGDLGVQIHEDARALVEATLKARSTAITESIACHALGNERRRLGRDLLQVNALQRELDRAPGPVELSGPVSLIVDLVRDTATQATYDLDSLVEGIAVSSSPLSEQARAELRACMEATKACIDVLIACELDRDKA